MPTNLPSAIGAMKPGLIFIAATVATVLMTRIAGAQMSPPLVDTSTLFGGTGSTSLFTGAASGAGSPIGLSPVPTSALPRLGTAGLSPNAPSAMTTLSSGGLSPATASAAPMVATSAASGFGLNPPTPGAMMPLAISPAPMPSAAVGGPHFTNYGIGGTQPLPGSPAGTFNGIP
jgi:hypothetical protein